MEKQSRKSKITSNYMLIPKFKNQDDLYKRHPHRARILEHNPEISKNIHYLDKASRFLGNIEDIQYGDIYPMSNYPRIIDTNIDKYIIGKSNYGLHLQELDLELDSVPSEFKVPTFPPRYWEDRIYSNVIWVEKKIIKKFIENLKWLPSTYKNKHWTTDSPFYYK
jgi:hypothetical protein